MIQWDKDIEVYLYREPVDMRKQLDGLMVLVSSVLEKPLQGRVLYLFYNRPRDKVKGLFWDRNGYMLVYKRLEHGGFALKGLDEDLQLSVEELGWLLSGFDFMGLRRAEQQHYRGCH